MKNWKVKYTHLLDEAARMPFHKRSVVVSANSRKDAIAKVSASFPPPIYGKYSASPTDKESSRMI